MASEIVDRQRMRAALDAVALRSVPVIALVLAALFAVLAVLTPVNNPGHVAFFATQLSLNSALCIVLFLSLRRWHPGPRWAHPILSGLLIITLTGSLTQMVIQADPLETVGVILNAIAVGLFMTSAAWFAGALAGIALSWGIAAWLAPPSPLHEPLATLLVQGLLLAVMIFVVRHHGLRRMETLLAQDQARQGELEAAVRELGQKEARFRLLAENAQDVVYRYIFRPARGVEYVSPSVLGLTGHSPQAFYDDPDLLMRIVHESDRGGIERDLKRSSATLQVFRLIRKDGQVVWCEQHRRPLITEEGKLIAIEGIVRDITRRKQAEDALLAQRDSLEQLSERLNLQKSLLSAVMESSLDGILVVDENQRTILANERFLELWRIPADLVAAADDAAMLHYVTDQIVDADAFLARVRHLYARPEEHSRDEIHLKDGRTLDRYSAPVRTPDGRYLGRVWSFRDITERAIAERRLAAQHAATRVLAEGDGIAETARKILEAVSSALGWDFAAVWLVDERNDVLRCVSTWRRNPGERSAFEEITRVRTFVRGIGLPGRVWASGEPAWIEDVTVDSNSPRAPYASSEGLHGAFGFPIRIHAQTIGVFEFFSGRIQKPDPDFLHLMASVGGTFGLYMERRHAEDEITRVNSELKRRLGELAEKTRDLESFSQSASHDLRAPLRAIGFLAIVLEEEQAGRLDASGREALARLRREADRMGQLIEDLLKLSRSTTGDLHPEPVDLGTLAAEVVQELRHREAGRDVEVIIQSPLEGEADPRLLKVALENLIGNAWKYTSRTPGARLEVGAIPGKPGEPILYFVRDNGVGFDVGQASKLFQPFQRFHGKEFPGTGIGLTTVQRIIQRHRGRIWAESEVGHGATFYFTLGTRPDHDG